MTPGQLLFTAVVLLGLGLWLLLPRALPRGRTLGLVLALAAVGLILGSLPALGAWPIRTLFYVLAGVTVVSGLGAITMRSPVYCALWFALSLLGTAGLFVFAGAQFLGVATVVVYAGAIVVTFLFVLMLANPEGHAHYDRLSFEAPLSACAGALMVGVLTITIGRGVAAPNGVFTAPAAAEADARVAGVLAEDHVARLGGRLFGEHLIAVELIAVLLMVALIGAAAVTGRNQMSGAVPAAMAGDAAIRDQPGVAR